MPKDPRTVTEFSGTGATEKKPREDKPSDPSPKAEDVTPETTLAVGIEAQAEEKEEDKEWNDRQRKTKIKPEAKWRKLPKP